MDEIDKTKLTDQTKFRLNEIKKIKNCFINDINQHKAHKLKNWGDMLLFLII